MGVVVCCGAVRRHRQRQLLRTEQNRTEESRTERMRDVKLIQNDKNKTLRFSVFFTFSDGKEQSFARGTENIARIIADKLASRNGPVNKLLQIHYPSRFVERVVRRHSGSSSSASETVLSSARHRKFVYFGSSGSLAESAVLQIISKSGCVPPALCTEILLSVVSRESKLWRSR